MHKHKCPNENCGVIWEHDRFDPYISHECPVCGTEQHYIYLGPDPVTAPDEIRLGQSLRGVLA